MLVGMPAETTLHRGSHNVAVGIAAPSVGTPVLVRVLGDLEVTGPDGAIEIRAGLPRTLLTMLAARVGSVVSADALIEQLWETRAPANPANALQVQVSYLRRQLRPLGDAIAIVRDGEGYRLAMDPEAIDAVRFDALATSGTGSGARSGAAAQPMTRASALAACRALDEALAWWRGDAFADAAHTPLVGPDHHRLEQRRVLAELRRSELLDRLGSHADAVTHLERLVAQHPFREDVWAALIGAMYRAGRQADALRAFARVRTLLVDELGIERGPELRNLEAAVLAHDPRLLHEPLPDDPSAAVPPTPAVERTSSPAAPRNATAPPRVPASISPLIGRGWEIDEVGALLDEHRLVTLTGPGGVGKSRLALESARTRACPVTVVELGAIADPAAVAAFVATSIPVPTDPRVDPIDAATARIADADWLLLLDTCEHVADAVAAFVAELLARCPRLRVLTTSRQPLHVGGEIVWRVPLLELPGTDSTRAVEVGAAAAVRLFVERARAVSPGFALTDTNAETVAAICRALDGLPLAIELAAARVGVLSPESLLTRLRDRFAVLTRGPRDAAARQRSLQAAVEWSFDQLDAREQCFFLALGTFPGDFGIEAAAAVAGTDELTALDLIDVLVERSLVVTDGDDRFWLLDTLREFARSTMTERDPSGEQRTDAQRRLARWVRDLTVAGDPYSHGPLPSQWPRLRAEAAMIRAALDWAFAPGGGALIGARIAGAIAGALALAGDFADAARWLASAQSVDLDDETAATVWRGVAVIEMYQGRFVTAVAAARRGYEHAEATGSTALSASCAIAYGSAAWGVGDLLVSRDLLRRAAEAFDEVGDVRGRGFALSRLARTASDLGDPSAARLAIAAVDDLETAHDDWVRVVALDHLAYALLAAGDHRAAAARAVEAAELGERIGSFSGRLAALATLGRVRREAGELAEALRVHGAAVRLALQIHNLGAIVNGLLDIADVWVARRRYREAALAAGAARSAARRATGADTPPSRHTELVDRLGVALDATELDRALTTGATLRPAEILDLAAD